MVCSIAFWKRSYLVLFIDTFNQRLLLLQRMAELGIEIRMLPSLAGATVVLSTREESGLRALNFFSEISDPRKLKGLAL